MENRILFEYLAIISPSDRIISQVMDMKMLCREKFRLDAAIYSKPHLTVFNLVQHVNNEDKLIKCLERNLEKATPFKIKLNGFDYFSNTTSVLYVGVEDNQSFFNLSQNVRKFTKPIIQSIKGYSPRFTYNAHLTVAKDIANSEFPIVWKNWKNLEYKACMYVNSLTLLRRPFTYLSSSYEVVGKYSFLGKESTDNQMSLF